MGKVIDMSGWVMSEHGVPDSRLTVIERAENSKNNCARWLCECSCEEHNRIIVSGSDLRRKDGNAIKSCGCLKKEKARDMGLQRPKENKNDLSGDFGIIWSSNTNEEIYFDLEDSEKILKHTWFINAKGYPAAQINGKSTTMHKFLGYKNHDHHNKNKLDNRKENLVQCTQQENCRNRVKHSNNKSGFTGVYWDTYYNKWVSQIKINEKTVKIGSFDNKNEAIVARLQAEKDVYKEFAPQRYLFEEYNI